MLRLPTFFQSARRQSSVAVHGIQRSGTNFLSRCLKEVNVRVLNSRQHRSSNWHKHCRWYAEDLIPGFLGSEFRNSYSARSFLEFAEATRYPANTLHLVIRKRRAASITSLCNWGLRCGWFSDEGDALGSIPLIAADYDRYYEFWDSMHMDAPDKIKLIDYHLLKESSFYLLEPLRQAGLEVSYASDIFSFEEVSQSPRNRSQLVVEAEVIARLSGERS